MFCGDFIRKITYWKSWIFGKQYVNCCETNICYIIECMKENEDVLGPKVEDYDEKKEVRVLKYLKKVSKGKVLFDSKKLFEVSQCGSEMELYKLLDCMTRAWHIKGLEFEEGDYSGEVALKNSLADLEITDIGKEFLANQMLINKILAPFDELFCWLEAFF